MRDKVDAYAARRIAAGWDVRAIATACGVSVRTAYRWRKTVRTVEAVEVDGYLAHFLLYHGRPPRQITSWMRLGDKPLLNVTTASDNGQYLATHHRRPSVTLQRREAA